MGICSLQWEEILRDLEDLSRWVIGGHNRQLGRWQYLDRWHRKETARTSTRGRYHWDKARRKDKTSIKRKQNSKRNSRKQQKQTSTIIIISRNCLNKGIKMQYWDLKAHLDSEIYCNGVGIVGCWFIIFPAVIIC